jgi:type III secretion protein R
MNTIFKKIKLKFSGRQKIYLVFLSLIMFGTFAVSTNTVLAQKADSPFGSANPVVLIIVVGMLSLAPFALIMLTSFVKISVVLSLLRNAMGTQQAPPNQVITGISLILSIFIMAPVVERMYQDAGTKIIFEEVKVENVIDIAIKGKEPLREFLKRFSSDENRVMFRDLAVRMALRNKVNNAEEITADDFRVIIPSFVTTELSKAFVIGFFIFIPFLVIDMIVSNILQAMGMFMLSPTTISLPFKLLLFVMTDGWTMLIKNLVTGYL